MKKRFVIISLASAMLFLASACSSVPAAHHGQDVQLPGSQNIQKPVIAILPFFGGQTGEGETIATLFSHQPALLDTFTVVTRTSTAMELILAEQGVTLTGLTDSDTIASLGRLLNADYVLSGSIRRLGDRNLLISTIVSVETFEQVAGTYQTYRILGDVPDILPLMSRTMVDATLLRGTARREYLAIVPFAHHAGISSHDAYTLTQILAIELIRTGRYALLPRTSTIEAARTEQGFQMEGDGIAALGRAANADFVLSGNIGSLGDVNVFIAQILRVMDGSVVV